MLKAWPWYLAALLWCGGIILFIRAAIGIQGYRIGGPAAVALVLEFLFAAAQFVLYERWRKCWVLNLNRQTPSLTIPSQGASFYYVLGVVGLCSGLVFIDIDTFGFLFSRGDLSSSVFVLAVAHGCLATARKLASIPDAIQQGAEEMAKLGLPRQVNEKEATRMGLGVLAIAVGVTLFLAISISSGFYDVSSGRLPRSISIPALLIILVLIFLDSKRR